MKNSVILCAMIFSTMVFAQTQTQLDVLDKFIRAHNDGSPETLKTFMEQTYNPKLHAKVNIDKQLVFYNQIIKEFGPLNPMIYKTVDNTQNRLVIHLIKASDHIDNKAIAPENILVVKLDFDPENPNYLSRGLGLGSLLCEQKR